MAKFTEKQTYYGFDPKREPPWQMVPLGGGRSVYLDDGANMKVKLKDPATMNDLSSSVATFNEVSTPGQYKREFEIYGHLPGKALLHAEDLSKSTRSAELSITILPAKITKLDFYRLCDNKGRCTNANPSEYPKLVKNVNYYFFTRTNVWLQKKSTFDLNVNYDFGDVIDADKLIEELNKVSGWPGTYPSIILVWDFKKKGSEYPDETLAFTKPPFIIMRDPKYDPEVAFRDKTLAHEIGHYFIGPDHHGSDNNLMGYHYPFGDSLLNKRQIIKFNRNKVAWW